MDIRVFFFMILGKLMRTFVYDFAAFSELV